MELVIALEPKVPGRSRQLLACKNRSAAARVSLLPAWASCFALYGGTMPGCEDAKSCRGNEQGRYIGEQMRIVLG